MSAILQKMGSKLNSHPTFTEWALSTSKRVYRLCRPYMTPYRLLNEAVLLSLFLYVLYRVLTGVPAFIGRKRHAAAQRRAVSNFLAERERSQYTNEKVKLKGPDGKEEAVQVYPPPTPTASCPDFSAMSARDIRDAVKRGTYSAPEVLLYFAHRAYHHGCGITRPSGGKGGEGGEGSGGGGGGGGAGRHVNAITEELYHVAYKESRELKSPLQYGALLHGVPISVKDCLGVKGSRQTGGLACRVVYMPSESDSALASTLRSSGALIMCRGNVSQCMMLPESRNNVFGETRNPWHLGRTPGGSSGGDAALVAMGCVPLAVGSDVGGSVRIPAAFCGVVGFKGTPGRVSKKGCMVPRWGDRHGMGLVIPSVVGPLAKKVDDCAMFMECLYSEEHFAKDTTVPPIPWRSRAYSDTVSSPKLRLAVFRTDGWFEPCPAAARVLDETVTALKGAGHSVVEVNFHDISDGWGTYALYVALAASEGDMRHFEEALDGEPLLEEYAVLKRASSLPNFLRPVVAKLIDKRRAELVLAGRSGGLSAYDLHDCMAEAVELRKKWTNFFHKPDGEKKFDALLHCALPLPALKLRTSKDLTGAFSYTLLANLLLFPAGTVPVGVVKFDEQHYVPTAGLPEDQRDFWAAKAENCMQGSEGLPLSVAVMTPMWKDEECLGVMKVVENLMKFGEKPEHKPKAYLAATGVNVQKKKD